MPPLLRLSFATDAANAESAERALEAAEPGPVSLARFADGAGWSVEALYPLDPGREAISALLRDALGHVPPFDLAPLADRDWVAESLEGLKPVRAGRFLVHGRHDREAAAPAPIPIEIEAGAAFGTGHHATTLGCLLGLDRLVPVMRAPRVLDLGTGTGVLAIAAARAWKAPVMATDIDPVAVDVARANARANAAGPLVEVVCTGTPVTPRVTARAPYDLVLANILAEPLRRLAAPVAALAARRGRVVLSGLLESQVRLVAPAWRARGFVAERAITIDGWATLVLARG